MGTKTADSRSQQGPDPRPNGPYDRNYHPFCILFPLGGNRDSKRTRNHQKSWPFATGVRFGLRLLCPCPTRLASFVCLSGSVGTPAVIPVPSHGERGARKGMGPRRRRGERGSPPPRHRQGGPPRNRAPNVAAVQPGLAPTVPPPLALPHAQDQKPLSCTAVRDRAGEHGPFEN